MKGENISMGGIKKRVKDFLKHCKFIRATYSYARVKAAETAKRIPFIAKSHALQNIKARFYFSGITHHPDPSRNLSGGKKVCYLTSNKAEQIASMLSMIRINIRPDECFQCWIDEELYTTFMFRTTDNMPPNYEPIIANSLDGLISEYSSMNNPVAANNVIILQAVCGYVDRIAGELDSHGLSRSAEIFRRMKDYPARDFEEALQRILLWQSIFWQSHHRLVGLGRLDKMLAPFIEPGKSHERVKMIQDFSDALHRHYGFKSNSVAKGDTGQIIILGGVEPDGEYFCNDLTYNFINAFRGHSLPDPKLLLRVSAKMPDDLLRLGVDCIATGIGCPLLANDDVIIPALEDFGYSHEDACNYVTSACWEPLSYGKSLEQNNIASINYARLIAEMYADKNFAGIKDFASLFALYKEKIKAESLNVMKWLDSVRWEEDPLMSLFTEDCLGSCKDISQGGAVYNNYGILTVGMSNAVNSLLNMKHILFGDKSSSMTLESMKAAAMSDYPDEEMRSILGECKYFGRDDEEALKLTNEITEYTAGLLRDYRNPFGGRAKFGLSSPNYVEDGRYTPATLDGRKSGEPLGVHISNPKGVPYTELVMFASGLDYSGVKSNGNVLDYFVSPAIIQDEREKFYTFIKAAIKAGFFEMQLNVVSAEKLIDAKRNPGKYPDLIVRVWGFSAYFDELPEEYKDVLIERALACEGKTA